MWFICKPLDTFAKRVHVRILENVDGHDDLVVSRHRIIHIIEPAKEGQPPTTNVIWPGESARYRNLQGVRSGLCGWYHRCICKPKSCPHSKPLWLERAYLCHGQIPVLPHNVIKLDESHGNHPIFDWRWVRVKGEYLQLYRIEVIYLDGRLGRRQKRRLFLQVSE